MGNYTIFQMFENQGEAGRQARNFTILNVPKILDLKSSSEQIFSKKLTLGAPDSRKYLLLRTDILQKTVVGCP